MYLQKYYGLISTGLVWVFEKLELFQAKIKKHVLQDCAKDLGTSKSRTKVAKRYRMVLFYSELQPAEQRTALAKLRKKHWINPRFSGHTRGIFQIHGIPEVLFYLYPKKS